MRSVTVTDASLNFSEMLLDAVEKGDEILLTHDGVTVARLVPERPSIAARIEDVMTRFPVDPAWADDLENTVRELRSEADQERTWPGE